MFLTDTQTMKDLGILDKAGGIYDLYQRATTRGGGMVLDEFLQFPLNDAAQINQRTGLIRHFSQHGMTFPFTKDLFDAAEQYLTERDDRTRLTVGGQRLGKKLTDLLASDAQHKTIVKGIRAVLQLLQQLQRFVADKAVSSNKDYAGEKNTIISLLAEEALKPLLAADASGRLSPEKLSQYDGLLRFRHYAEVRRLLQYMYQLDAYLTIGRVAVEKGFCFPEALPYSGAEGSSVCMEEVWHPGVAGARGNTTRIDSRHNVVFLTGANMAGKSTFMKSVGIAMYLAHTGMPVAAKRMTFTVMDGLFTTINLPDDLGMGASHFYAEVLRLKMVARELYGGRRLFIVFDELFRGTNVKDAGEATVEVVDAFAGRRNSLFIISTHIIEAGDALKDRTDHIRYHYLPTRMEGNRPVYTYRLEEGITEDRHGMVIIRNEGILETLKITNGIHNR